jgi:hypothetical protein
MIVCGENYGTFIVFNELLKAVIDSKSKWLVGSSSIKTLALSIIIRDDNIQRTFSPPDNSAGFKASSPENHLS